MGDDPTWRYFRLRGSEVPCWVLDVLRNAIWTGTGLERATRPLPGSHDEDLVTMKYRIRDADETGIKVRKLQRVESAARVYLAKAIILSGLLLLTGCAVYFACMRNGAELSAMIHSVTLLMGFVLGHYFKSRDG
jgi:hypothetical protein